jgi:hypothetical protein
MEKEHVVSSSMLVREINDKQSLFKPMRIIPYHISRLLVERHKDAYEALMEAASTAVVVDHLESHRGVDGR